MKCLLLFLLGPWMAWSQQFDYAKDYPAIAKQSLNPDSSLSYDKLRLAFIDHGENFSKEMTLALMIGQTVSEMYDPYGDKDLELACRHAAEAPSDTIYKYAPMYLEINPVSISVNYGLWKTYEKDKDLANAAKYEKRFRLLCETILSTGNATSKPCFVVSATDAWALIELYKGDKIGSLGSGRSASGNRVEILEVYTKTKSHTEYYIIDPMFVSLREQFMDTQSKDTIIEMDSNGKIQYKKP